MTPRWPIRIACAVALLGGAVAGVWLLRGVAAPLSARASIADRPPTDFRGALSVAFQETDPNLRSWRFNGQLREWLARDPAAALHYLRGLPARARAYTGGLLLVLGAIAETDPARALDLAREMVETREQAAIYSVIFAQIAATGAPHTPALLEKVPAGVAREKALSALASTWAARDPDAALRWAQTLAAPADRTEALAATLTLLAKDDPARTLAVAPGFLAGPTLDRVLSGCFAQMARNDPRAASQAALALPDGLPKSTAVPSIARALAAESAEEALAWSERLPPELQRTALQNVLSVWAQLDPDAAQYVEELPGGSGQIEAARHLARELAAIDPASATAWSQKLTPQAQAAAEPGIASAWARTDAPAAAQWAATLPESSAARAASLQSALSYWALQDSRAASAFVPTLPESDQPAAVAALVPVLAQHDPAAALQTVQAWPDADNQALGVEAVIARWADNAPPAAARWVAAEPASNAQIDHARAVVEHWMTADPPAALAWARAFPPSATRDGALDMAAARLTAVDGNLARQCAQAIGSAALREARLAAMNPGQ